MAEIDAECFFRLRGAGGGALVRLLDDPQVPELQGPYAQWILQCQVERVELTPEAARFPRVIVLDLQPNLKQFRHGRNTQEARQGNNEQKRSHEHGAKDPKPDAGLGFQEEAQGNDDERRGRKMAPGAARETEKDTDEQDDIDQAADDLLSSVAHQHFLQGEHGRQDQERAEDVWILKCALRPSIESQNVGAWDQSKITQCPGNGTQDGTDGVGFHHQPHPLFRRFRNEVGDDETGEQQEDRDDGVYHGVRNRRVADLEHSNQCEWQKAQGNRQQASGRAIDVHVRCQRQRNHTKEDDFVGRRLDENQAPGEYPESDCRIQPLGRAGAQYGQPVRDRT